MEITTKQKFSYGLGGFGKNVAYGLVSSYILYYFNKVLGISATYVGILLMAARIFDAINDPFMGVVVAKTKSPYGRYKPWILTGAVLNCLIMCIMFSAPIGLDDTGLKIFAAVTYILCGITYTFDDIPYWSIVPALTRPGKDRESMTVFARGFAAFGVGVPTILTMSAVPVLGGGDSMLHYRSGFSRLSIIIAIIYLVTTIITVINLPGKEITEPKEEKVGDLIKALLKNDYAMILAAIYVTFNTATLLTTSLAVYIFDYDINNMTQYTIFMAINAVIQLSSMVIFYPLLRKRLSNRGIFTLAILCALAGFAIFGGLIAVPNNSFFLLIIPSIMVSFANGLGYVLITLMVAGAVDYGEAKTGKREDSIVSSLQTLMVKASTAFAAFVAGVGIDLSGIRADAQVQSHSAIVGLRILFVVPSLILMVIALVLFLKFKMIGADVSKEVKGKE